MQMNMETQIGREAFSNIAGNYVREWSVGFNIPGPDAVTYDKAGKDSTRRILNLDWVEVSSVVRGASPATMTIAAKSAEDTEPTEELESAISEISLDDIKDTASATGDESAADTVALEIALLRTRLRLQQKLIA
jgi:phage head maturation protease